MAGFPQNLSALELLPNIEFESARDDRGHRWDVEREDAYWVGRAQTSKLNHAELQDWEGFLYAAIAQRTVIDFVDPIYRHPRAYWDVDGAPSTLPSMWDGSVTLESVADANSPVFSGFPVGLVLKRGDRLSLEQGDGHSYHMLSADVTVSSALSQAVPVVPRVLVNVFAEGAGGTFVDPVVKLQIEPGSVRPARSARQNTLVGFVLLEAPVEN